MAVESVENGPVTYSDWLFRQLGPGRPFSPLIKAAQAGKDVVIANQGEPAGAGASRADESHRARLRVEVGRLRTVLRTIAGVSATKRGFGLAPRRACEVVVLARPVEEEHAAVLALPTVSRGRARRWRWRLAPASAPCSGHSTGLRQQARCSRLVAGERVAGLPRPCRDLRRPCYSPRHCRVASVLIEKFVMSDFMTLFPRFTGESRIHG
jgi:hypothetical protein